MRDLELKNKRVLVRSDLNVPIVNGRVADDARIKASIPTYQHILAKGGQLAIMSHLGRPDLSAKNTAEFSLAPLVPILAQMLDKEVELLPEFVPGLDPNKVYLYENTRLMAGEKSCCPQLAKNMASCADIFIMDAFASCHRQDASTYGILEYVPEYSAGLLLAREVEVLSGLLNSPKAPVMAVIGGAKISGKIDVIMSMLDIVDSLVVVGAMANTFLAAAGYNVGQSLYEKDKVELALDILTVAKKKQVSCYLPEDVVVMNADEEVICKDVADVKSCDTIYDIGDESLCHLENILGKTKTLMWNGPLGKYEDERFAQGGIKFAKIVAKADVNSIAGGGDTISVIKAAGVYADISYISTGGGAFLSLLEDKKLPCLEKLSMTRKANAKTN